MIWKTEEALFNRGCSLVAGSDEVGRGPLAGPVVAAVIVFDSCGPANVADSKTVSPVRRVALQREILAAAVAVGISAVDNNIIDAINILEASRLAMYQAWDKLPVKAEYLLLDGGMVPQLERVVPCRALPGGDRRCGSIAAASIVAKVYRDRLMEHYEKLYPGYGFARNKGYPTREHLSALARLGPTPIHRKSFRGVIQ